jgi:hypothetical protein
MDDIIAIQEGAAGRNLASAAALWTLIDSALGLGYEITDYLHQPLTIEKRKCESAEVRDTRTMIANLLHSAWCSLACAARVGSWGATSDSLALIRSGFEYVAFAELFRRVPTEAKTWNEIGLQPSLEERRRQLQAQFSGVWTSLDRMDAAEADPSAVREDLEDAIENTRRSFYRELSSFGPHPNPASVVMRMSTAEVGVQNLGFASAGKPEAVEYVALRCLNVLMFCLSEFIDSFAAYLLERPDIHAKYEALSTRYEPFHALMVKPVFSQEFVTR